MKTLNYKIIGATLLVAQFATVQNLMAEEPGGSSENSVNVVQENFTVAVTNREAMTTEIIDRLREGAEAKGLDGWESELTAALNAASDEAFLAAYNAGSYYKAVAAAASGISFDKATLVNNLNAGGMPDALLGSNDKDFLYTPFPPCRVVDTRTAGGKINGGTSRGFDAHGNGAGLAAQGGHAGGCLVNGNSDAFGGYVFNITVVAPEANGHIRIYAQGDPLPPASIVNFVTGQTIANSTVVKSGHLVGKDFRVYASARTHVIVDVMGYFEKPERTMPDILTVIGATATVGGNSNANLAGANCPAGWRLTSGGIDVSSFAMRIVESRAGSTAGVNTVGATWHGAVRNTGAASATANLISYCSRTPGK